MRRNAARRRLDQRPVERWQSLTRQFDDSLAQGSRDPPDQAVVKLGGKIGPGRQPLGFAAPPALGGEQRHRRAGDHTVGMLDQPGEQAGAIGILRRIHRQGLGQHILARASDQLAHQLGIAQQAGRGEPVENRCPLFELRGKFGRITGGEQARCMAPHRTFDRGDQRGERAAERRTQPFVEPRVLGQKEIVDRDREPVIGAQICCSRAGEQLADPPVGAIIHVAVIARHVPRLRDLSLRPA